MTSRDQPPASLFDRDAFAELGEQLAELTAAPDFDAAAYKGILVEAARLTARARFASYLVALAEGYPVAGGGRWSHHTRRDFEAYVARFPKALAEHPRSWCRWTDAEETDLTAAVHQGTSIHDIATAHQRTPNAIEQRVTLLGLDLEPQTHA